MVGNGSVRKKYDKAINATGYRACTDKEATLPLEMEVTYQPCMALVYEDKQSGPHPISFIVMDGWFPCLMPYIEDNDVSLKEGAPFKRKYILTHGKWTIMGSYPTSKEATDILSSIKDEFIKSEIKPRAESEMMRFWPGFKERFEYVGFKGQVLAKLKTKKEFRSAVTYERDHLIHIVPGKVSNIFDAEDEVLSLIHNTNILIHNGCLFVKDGVLDQSRQEVVEKPAFAERSTSNLRTLDELNANHGYFYAMMNKINNSIRYSQERFFCQHQYKHIASPNYSFLLKCVLTGIIGSLSLVCAALLALPSLSLTSSVLLGSSSAAGLLFCAYMIRGMLKYKTPVVTEPDRGLLDDVQAIMPAC